MSRPPPRPSERKAVQTVIFLGKADDPHLELVQAHMRSPVHIINVAYDRLTFSLPSGARSYTVYHNGEELDLSAKTVRSVWYRRLSIRKLRPKLQIRPPEEHESAISAMQHLADALPYQFDPEVFWLPHYATCIAAEEKPSQLPLAAACGLRVLETVFTSDAQHAADFMRAREASAIKTLARCAPKGREIPTMKKVLTEMTFGGPTITPPLTFQEPIDPLFEVRVAVIGNQVFASIIEDLTPPEMLSPGTRDVRSGFLRGTWRTLPHYLPVETAKACIEVVRRRGLPAGYIDLIYARDKSYYFLEVNPNGEWSFMDSGAVQGISRAIARMLETGQSPW